MEPFDKRLKERAKQEPFPLPETYAGKVRNTCAALKETTMKDTKQKHSGRALLGVAAALARLRWAGYLLIVVTNQSGIARGYYDERAMQALHDWMDADLRAQGAHIDAFYHCPHDPDLNGACTCRKPAPGMLLRAADDWFIDLERSWMIGDKMSDVVAGRAAGCTPILLSTTISLPDEEPPLLRAARERNIPICVTSDAHRAADLTFAFRQAAELARACGYRESMYLTEGGFQPGPLPEG